MTGVETFPTLYPMTATIAHAPPPLLDWARAERDRLAEELQHRRGPDEVLARIEGAFDALESVIALLELEQAFA